MSTDAPALQALAHELRRLRTEHWPDSGGLTQAALARALGGTEPLAPATVASWENKNTPKLPPRERVLAYAQFFATRRSMEPKPHLIQPDGFTPEENVQYKELCDKLLQLHGAVRGTDEPAAARRSWQFTDSAPLTLICAPIPEEHRSPLAFSDSPNYTDLLSFADLDAMVQLYGHIRAENPSMRVEYKTVPTAPSDEFTNHMSGHVATIGGIGWNPITTRLLDLARLPVQQRADPAVKGGEIFVTKTADGEQKYLPTWSATEPPELFEDVGLLARMPNPFNSACTLTMCNGIYSHGVYGAVRTLTDTLLQNANERYIAENFPDQEFCILMRVRLVGGRVVTPDFGTKGTILYQWPPRASA